LIKYYSAGGLALGLNTGATASTISYTAADGLGSLQVSLSSAGIPTALQLNAPYGAVRYSSGVFPTAKGFTGERSAAVVSGRGTSGPSPQMMGYHKTLQTELSKQNRRISCREVRRFDR
jgi:hypothetical protein